MYFPDGKYLISQPLRIYEGITLAGNSQKSVQIIQHSNAAHITGNDCNWVTIKDISFKGPGMNSSNGGGIGFGRQNNPNITGTYMENVTVERQLEGLEDTFKTNPHWLPATIAFDDFKSGKFAQSRMSMILMNPQNHRTIDIIQSRNSRFMRNYFLSHYSKKARWSVKIVVVDLFEPYRNLIHDLFPQAMIVADHFHVVVQAYRALQSARLKVMKEYGANTHEYRALKHYWKLLMTKEGQLDYLHYYSRRNFYHACLSNQDVVERLLNFSPELRAAYEYYQDLIAAISHRSQTLLDQLIKRNNLPNVIRRVKRTLAKHRQEIIASFYTRLTNGPIEGTNNKIKIIKRTAYGYRNFFHFRIRILISLKNSNLMIRELPKRRTRPIAKVA